ncbi:MAG: hypothetical protein V4558_13645 [Gemmatimonadota bacterium]
MSPAVPTPQSPAERRAAEAELKALLARIAPDHQRLAAAVRKFVQKRLPTSQELVYEYADSVVLSFTPNGQGKDGVVAIRASADEIRLYLSGKGLPDPQKLLNGAATTRWIVVEGASTLTQPAVTALIEAAIARNKLPYPTTGIGSVVVRATTASKRRG